MMETRGVAMSSPENACQFAEDPARPFEADSRPEVGQAPCFQLGDGAKEIVHVGEGKAEGLAGVLGLQTLASGVERLLPLPVLDSLFGTGYATAVFGCGLGDKRELFAL